MSLTMDSFFERERNGLIELLRERQHLGAWQEAWTSGGILSFHRRGCGKGEEDGGKQTPGETDGTGDAKSAQGRIIGYA
jgi:hypothetical protein